MSNDTVASSGEVAVPRLEDRGGRVLTVADVEELRSKGNVHYNPEDRSWLFLGYDDVYALARDARLSKNPMDSWRKTPASPGNMMQMDGPDHARMRSVLALAFSPRSLAYYRPRMVACLDELFDEALKGPFDFVSAISTPFAPAVVGKFVMRLDETEMPPFQSHIATIRKRQDPSVKPADVAAAREAILELWRARIRRAEHETSENNFSRTIYDALRAGELSEVEATWLFHLAFIAGHGSSINALSMCALTLLEHPDQVALLRRSPELVKNAVEELLRFRPSTIRTQRYATTDFEYGGHKIKAGDTVGLLLDAGGREPGVTPSPMVFDVTRKSIRHHSFGGGPHFCTGVALARLELELLIEGLIRRAPELRLDTERPPVYQEFSSFRELSELWVIP
jgi:cytochrome P450